jgi:glyoxylase-like metal-dependent hydrolase (beta-lactamase superfamily II)
MPAGVEAFPAHKPNDTVLWVESSAAIISGDTLVGFGRSGGGGIRTHGAR